LFLNKPLEKQGVESILVGHEENVLIQSKNSKAREKVFLDHDLEDTTTEEFWRLQNRVRSKFKRSYLDEIYSIIDGVKFGLGKAVVPQHLIEKFEGIEVVAGYKKLKTPVYLNFYTQPFYTNLHKEVIKFLKIKIPRLLG
jgi:hypothetical protein